MLNALVEVGMDVNFSYKDSRLTPLMLAASQVS